MREFNKLFGIGLPRCSGQTLQEVLGCLFVPREGCCWHSVGVHIHDCMTQPNARAAVETFYHPAYLKYHYPNSLYVLNIRDKHQWLRSCANVYHQSYDYNHPLWKYTLDYFDYYYDEYMVTRLEWAEKNPYRCLVWDIFKQPTWQPICEFLQVDPPRMPFPRIDDHVARNAVYDPCSLIDEFGYM